MPVIPFGGKTPVVADSAWIAPDAWVIGDVTIGENVSVFFGAVLRGDIFAISVGRGTNIQEGALLHTSTGLTPCVVGEDVTVGHHAILHGCTVKDCCIIGMASTILDEAIIESKCLIGANSLVKMKFVATEKTMSFGSPAKIARKLSEEEVAGLARSAADYRTLGAKYRAALSPK